MHEIKPPFSPAAAVAEIAALLKSYGVTCVTGDKWGLNLVAELFQRHGIRYIYSERDRSEIFVQCLPLLTSGRARLVDHKKLVTQFCALERKTSPGGKETITHPTGSHDDLCNAAAGCLVELALTPQAFVISAELMAWAATPARRYGAYVRGY